MPIGTSLSREEWLLACKQAHGDKYDYTDTIFGKHDEVIEVRCKHHNLKFRTRLTRHANGRGSCPSCAYDGQKTPFSKWVSGVDTGRTWNLFWCRKLEGDLRPVEKSIKEYLDTYYSKPSVRFDGFTESYVLDGKSIPLPFILSAVNF